MPRLLRGGFLLWATNPRRFRGSLATHGFSDPWFERDLHYEGVIRCDVRAGGDGLRRGNANFRAWREAEREGD